MEPRISPPDSVLEVFTPSTGETIRIIEDDESPRSRLQTVAICAAIPLLILMLALHRPATRPALSGIATAATAQPAPDEQRHAQSPSAQGASR